MLKASKLTLLLRQLNTVPDLCDLSDLSVELGGFLSEYDWLLEGQESLEHGRINEETFNSEGLSVSTSTALLEEHFPEVCWGLHTGFLLVLLLVLLSFLLVILS
jgi:hypothetical protein